MGRGRWGGCKGRMASREGDLRLVGVTERQQLWLGGKGEPASDRQMGS